MDHRRQNHILAANLLGRGQAGEHDRLGGQHLWLGLQPGLKLLQTVQDQGQGLVLGGRVVPVQIQGGFQARPRHQRRSRFRR
jgi:hypothetical protein